MKIHGTAQGGALSKKDFGVAFSSAGNGFSPSDIDDLYLWLDATDSDTITKDGSDRISKWENKEGTSDRDCVQSTSGDQPLYVSSGSSDSGNATVNFSGDRWMETASALTGISQPISFIAITKFPPNSTSTNEYLFAKEKSEGGTRFIFSKPTADANDRFIMYAGTDFIESSVTGIANEWTYATLIYDGASSQMRFNGSEIDTGNVGSETFEGLTLGARDNSGAVVYYWNTEIMHFLIYEKELTSDDIENIETWAEEQMNG